MSYILSSLPNNTHLHRGFSNSFTDLSYFNDQNKLIAKYTSAMYSELPPSEKEAWVTRAENDKARYLHELASYVPPPGYDPKGDAIISPVLTTGGRKGKPEKDINAPKRNMSA